MTVNSRVPTDTNSLERLVPEHVQAGDVTGKETLKLHLDRYEFAARHIRPGPALDIACGVGYGTHLVAERCGDGTEFVGADISSEAVEYARGNYSRAKVRFEVGDAMRFEDPNGFETIISLETIEHLPDPKGFVARLVKLLRPRGVLIGSVPTTPSVDANPHHLHDFTERSFRKMVSVHGLREIDCFRQVQPFHPVPLLSRREVRARDIRRNLSLFYVTHPGSLMRRILATVRYGFANHYITIAWQKSDES